MPGCAHPVYFSRSAPFDVNSGLLIFYDVVEPGVMARSDVLSCIAVGDPEAKLPESITVSDFRNWVHAVTDSEAIIQSRPLVYVLAIVKVVPLSRYPSRPSAHVQECGARLATKS